MSSPMPPADPSAVPPVESAAPKARFALARSLWRTLVVCAVGVPLGFGLAAFGILHTEAGTRGLLPLLTLIPVVKIEVERPHGPLLGPQFGAHKLRVAWSQGQAFVEITDFEWQGAQWRWWTGPGLWASVKADSLVAREVVVHTGPPSGKAISPPGSMRLPLEIQVQRVQADDVRVDALEPFHAAQGRVHLGRDAGARHEVLALTFDWGHARAQGQAQLEADSPFKVQASVQATPREGPHFNAQAQAVGSFTDFTVKAQLRGDPWVMQAGGVTAAITNATEPQLDASLQVLPFHAWPLGALQLSTRALDLKSLVPFLPHTRLSGQASLGRKDRSSAVEAKMDLQNERPGRWDQGLLPVARMRAEAQSPALSLDKAEIRSFEITLAASRESPPTKVLRGARERRGPGLELTPSGRWSGRGTWTGQELSLDTKVQDLRPQLMDHRAPAMRLSGPLSLRWRGGATLGGSSPTAPFMVGWLGELEGRLDAAPQVVTLVTQGEFSAQGLEIQRLQATSGAATADLKLRVHRDKGHQRWQARSEGTLSGFDPAAWYPGPEGTAWRRGPNRLNARWQLDLQAPASATPRAVPEWLQSLQGEGRLDLAPSQLAGVSMEGFLRMEREATDSRRDARTTARSRVRGEWRAGRNRLEFDGSGDPLSPGDADQLRLQIQGQALGDLGPLASIHPSLSAWIPRQGTAEAQVLVEGRWPRLRTSGTVKTRGLTVGELTVAEGSARWQVATGKDQPVDVQVDVQDAAWAAQRVKMLRASVQGSSQSHRLQLEAAAPVHTPAWLERALGLKPGAGTQAQLVGEGSWEAQAEGGGLWRGQFNRLTAGVWDGQLKGTVRPEGSWFDAQGLKGEVRITPEGQISAVRAAAGQALIAAGGSAATGGQAGSGVPLKWEEFVYQMSGSRQDLVLQAEVPPTPVAAFLQRATQGAWSGDLKVAARVNLRAAENFDAQWVLRRESGDLILTDNGSTQAMGLTAAELTLSARDGVWKVMPKLAGKSLGQLSGEFTLRTAASLRWPDAQATLEGALDLSVANLNIWSAWVPPGWRIAGSLNTSAKLGGRFGAPQFTGELVAQGVDVRNLLQGIAFSDGELKVALNGETARVERLRLRAGDGDLTGEGVATLGLTPTAQLNLLARQFRVLGRVDRQLVLSGQGSVGLRTDLLQAQGQLKVDSGLFDLSSRDAPTLDDDVVVLRQGNSRVPVAEPIGPSRWVRAHQVAVSIDLGDHLKVKGRGLDTALKGQVQLSTPEGHLSLSGSLNAAGGTYAAYGQKLEIERGVVAFSGPPESARLDILALRPNIDNRVGVSITGPALNPRVRLYSEPAMSESDKLSWLVLGRGSEGLGRADTAVLQRAAVALMAGEGEGPNDSLMRAFGLDNVSLRQGDTDVRETVISLGKQLSQRWYVGYERGVNATSGTWQLIYRIAQRFTLRAQSGMENSLDLIWTWRFDKP